MRQQPIYCIHIHTQTQAHTLTFTHTQASCQLLTRQIGTVCTQWPQFISPLAPLHLFENDWTRECKSNMSWWLVVLLQTSFINAHVVLHFPQIPPTLSLLSRSDFSPVTPNHYSRLLCFFRTISQIWSPTTASIFSACPRRHTLIVLWWWSSAMLPLTAQKTQLHSMLSTSPMLRSICK